MVLPLPTAGPQVYDYFSNTTNATYLLNTNASIGAAAEAWCTTQGGHLAAYSSLEEQVEVEQVSEQPPAAAHGSWHAITRLNRQMFSGRNAWLRLRVARRVAPRLLQ